MKRSAVTVRNMVLASCVSLGLMACDRTPVPGGEGSVTMVTVTPADSTLNKGDTKPLTVTVAGSGTYSSAVIWKSDKESIATVSDKGVVTAVAPGDARITATSTADPSKFGAAQVSVKVATQAGTVTKVTVSPGSATLTRGASQTLTATVEGTGTYGIGVTWTSNNTAVATVSSSGTVTAVSPGQATITVTSAFDPSKSGTAAVTVTASAANARLVLTNLDGGPFANRLSFSKVDRDLNGNPLPVPSPSEHNISTLRIGNSGTEALTGSVAPAGNFKLLSPATFSVAPGGTTDIKVQFTGSGSKVQTGTLTITSNDSQMPATTVQLAGAWQDRYENNQEPSLAQLVNGTLGFSTAFTTGAESINQLGRVRAQGDEVLSAYWQRADASKPVDVWQVASYHTQGNPATLFFFGKPLSKASASTAPIVVSAGSDSQSLLPRLSGSASQPARVSVTPTFATFGFRVDGDEWTDPALNDQTADQNQGCVQPCGQHLRFYRAKDPAGNVMPDSYLLVMDYSGINYDYNDNVYLISNIRPAPQLIDTGTRDFRYADPSGNVWVSDVDRNGYALFSPSTAPDEQPASAAGVDILNTTNDQLYRSYRGFVGNLQPRTLSYAIPLDNGSYQVKLHFAELNWQTANNRIFNVFAEGTLRVDNLDIVARAGAWRTAHVETLSNVQVGDGTLNLSLTASKDYPAISGIEISR